MIMCLMAQVLTWLSSGYRNPKQIIPEWQDPDGPRLQQIDWFAESEYSGTQPTNFYTDTNGHGTHCIGTMAGKYFGWAQERKNL